MIQNDDNDVDMTQAAVTLLIDADKAEPIERETKIVVIESPEYGGSSTTNNSFEDEILQIELNPEEQRLFDTLKKAAKAWGEGKLTINKKTVQIRIAGGWVRDKILGLQTHDVDIALDTCTGAEFAHAVKEYHTSVVQDDEMTDSNGSNKNSNNRIGKIGVIAANPAQSKHLETATVRIFGNDVDFSNLRSETYAEDSRIPDTVMGTPLEDSFRRDCTMNALYYNLNTELVEDWTRRGLQDLLKTKVVHTPLKAFQTFQDDPLRVLRVIRFAVRYQMELSDEIKKACEHPQIHNELRRKVSRERVGNELEGMLSGRHANPIQAMDLICSMNLADSVFYPPSGIDIMGTVAQARLEPIPYMHTGVGEEELSRMRATAWEETRECLQVLSTVLTAFQVQRDDDSASAVDMKIPLMAANSGAANANANVNAVTPIDGRLVYLAVVIMPYMKLQYLEKQRTKTVVEYMIREGIKFKNKDVLFLGLLRQNLDEMVRLLQQQQQQQTAEVTPTMRLQAGLLLRSTKEMWVTTLIVATVILSRKQGMCSQDVDDWCTRAKELYETIVVGMNLDECWKTKPLMHGKELIRVLELDRGPVVGVYMEEQVKWVLTNPKGTIEELQGHLQKFKATRELESDDEAAQHVSKKMHL